MKMEVKKDEEMLKLEMMEEQRLGWWWMDGTDEKKKGGTGEGKREGCSSG